MQYKLPARFKALLILTLLAIGVSIAPAEMRAAPAQPEERQEQTANLYVPPGTNYGRYHWKGLYTSVSWNSTTKWQSGVYEGPVTAGSWIFCPYWIEIDGTWWFLGSQSYNCEITNANFWQQ